jgi:hypothetical protein
MATETTTYAGYFLLLGKSHKSLINSYIFNNNISTPLDEMGRL